MENESLKCPWCGRRILKPKLFGATCDFCNKPYIYACTAGVKEPGRPFKPSHPAATSVASQYLIIVLLPILSVLIICMESYGNIDRLVFNSLILLIFLVPLDIILLNATYPRYLIKATDMEYESYMQSLRAVFFQDRKKSATQAKMYQVRFLSSGKYRVLKTDCFYIAVINICGIDEPYYMIPDSLQFTKESNPEKFIYRVTFYHADSSPADVALRTEFFLYDSNMQLIGKGKSVGIIGYL